MPISRETTDRLIKATKQAAAAFVEDVAHIREVVENPVITAGELRRLSGVLRRILIDKGGDLSFIAPPRVGKIHLIGLDNNPVYRSSEKRPYRFLSSGGASAFGVIIRLITSREGSNTPPEGFDPDRTVELGHDGFLNQKVICLDNNWVNRRSIIKYIANTASGVHSSAINNETDELIAKIRNAYRLSIKNGDISIDISVPTEPLSSDFKFSYDSIDIILFELLCTAHFFVNSPDVQKLEESIKAELGLSNISAQSNIR